MLDTKVDLLDNYLCRVSDGCSFLMDLLVLVVFAGFGSAGFVGC